MANIGRRKGKIIVTPVRRDEPERTFPEKERPSEPAVPIKEPEKEKVAV